MMINQKMLSQARKTRGYLDKKSSGFIAIWQRRYFLILDNSLTYYGDETLTEQKKSIELGEINSIKIVEANEFHLVTKKRIYQLRADNESDRDLWAASLNILMTQRSSSKSPTTKISQPPQSKITPPRPLSKPKKQPLSKHSPPPLRKMSSMVETSIKEGFLLSAEDLFQRMGLPGLANSFREDHLRNKLIMVPQFKSCYFIICSKTPFHSHEDEQFLSQETVRPLKPNILYRVLFDQIGSCKAEEVAKCSDIRSVEEQSNGLRIDTSAKTIINLDFKQCSFELSEQLSLGKKILQAVDFGKEYYNDRSIKVRRNIDKILYSFNSKSVSINELAKRQLQKCWLQSKQANPKHGFRKNLEVMKKSLQEIVDCCDISPKERGELKEKFARQFQNQVINYVQKGWEQCQKMTLAQQKKILFVINDFSKVIREAIKDSKIFQQVLVMHQKLLQKYEEQIKSKIDCCFSLSEKQILEEIAVEIKADSDIVDQVNTFFYSNTIFRQFHVDIRLVLSEFQEMPIHQKILRGYLFLFSQLFKYISERTFGFLDKWKDHRLLLGTCNQIEFIKNLLFEEMYSQLTKEYKSLNKEIRQVQLKQLQFEISSTQNFLMKNLFVSAFSTLDRGMLSKPFDELPVGSICEAILLKIKTFNKINKYVRRNIFEASFEEICYFYYTTIIKFSRGQSQAPRGADFFAKKIVEDLKAIQNQFSSYLKSDKIYTHLKDLSLLKEFIVCDSSQVKKVCTSLKKQFGNSFTEMAVTNLLSLRDMSPQNESGLILQCCEVVKNSADTPEQISMMSNSYESFLDNWNNARSRKSTLTMSLNEFYENQHSMHQSKLSCAIWKQGYLWKKKVNKHSNSTETRAFFIIKNSRLEQYESEQQEQIMSVFDLTSVKKCQLHPEKNYAFFLELPDYRIYLKAESAEEAKEWVRHIHEEMGPLSTIKDIPHERPSELSTFDNLREGKDFSTMESYKTMKDRSLERSASNSPMLKKGKRPSDREKEKEGSPDKQGRTGKESRAKAQPGEENCLKCSRGFFF